MEEVERIKRGPDQGESINGVMIDSIQADEIFEREQNIPRFEYLADLEPENGDKSPFFVYRPHKSGGREKTPEYKKFNRLAEDEQPESND